MYLTVRLALSGWRGVVVCFDHHSNTPTSLNSLLSNNSNLRPMAAAAPRSTGKRKRRPPKATANNNDAEPTAVKPELDHKTMCLSLVNALHRVGNPVHERLILDAIQHITRTVSEAVCLTSMLATDYLLGELAAHGWVPSVVGAHLLTFFSQVHQCVTSLRGSMAVQERKCSPPDLVALRTQLTGSRVVLFGADFVYPARDLLTNIFSSQHVRMVTNMENMYTMTFDKRQWRAVQTAVQQRVVGVPKALMTTLIRYTIHCINGTAHRHHPDITPELEVAVKPIMDEHRVKLADFRLYLTLRRQFRDASIAAKLELTCSDRNRVVLSMCDVVLGRASRSLPSVVEKLQLEGKRLMQQLILAQQLVIRRKVEADASRLQLQPVAGELLALAASESKGVDENDDERTRKKKARKEESKAEVAEAKKSERVEAELDAVYADSLTGALHLIIPYFYFLWLETQPQAEDPQKHMKKKQRGFPVCPQQQRKVHHIDLSALGLMELASVVDASPQDAATALRFSLNVYLGLDKRPKAIRKEAYVKAHSAALLHKLFAYPKDTVTRTFSVPAVTNGRQLWLHYKTPPPLAGVKTKKSGKRKAVGGPPEPTKQTINIAEKSRGVFHYDKEVLFAADPTIAKFGISVDPGHANVIVARRPFDVVDPAVERQKLQTAAVARGGRPSKRGRRRLARVTKQHAAEESIYTLTNSKYHQMAGMTAARLKREGWRRQDGLTEIDRRLSQDGVRKNTFNRQEYRRYCALVSSTWKRLFDHAFRPKQTKLRFATYQAQQRAFHKVALDLAGSKPLSQCFLIWGDGGFGPTSKGHDSAPNKKLYHALSQYMPVVISSEWGTSKYSFCCSEAVSHPLRSEYDCNWLYWTDEDWDRDDEKAKCNQRVRGLSICPCGQWWSRDAAAALWIFKAFREHVRTGVWINRQHEVITD